MNDGSILAAALGEDAGGTSSEDGSDEGDAERGGTLLLRGLTKLPLAVA